MTTWLLTIEALFLIVVCVGAISGNVLLFVVVSKSHRLRTKSNFFILNLAVADLLVAVINMPVTIVTVVTQEWILGEVVCQVSGFFTLLTFVASCMALTMISVNRYHAIVHWNIYHDLFLQWKCRMYVVIVWAITIGLSIPPFFGWASFDFDKGQSYCFVEWTESESYTIFMIATCLLGPLFVMTYCYVRIIRFRRESRRHVLETTGPGENSLNTSRTVAPGKVNPRRTAVVRLDEKLTRTVITLIVVFALCWSPFAVTMATEVFAGISLPRFVVFGALIVGYMNSFCDVFVYGITNRHIRKGYKKLIACKLNQIDAGS